MKIYHQNVFDSWPLKDRSVQAIITSPPYWGLRKYDIPDVIIGGRTSCSHEFIETINPKGNGDGMSPRRDKKAGLRRGIRQPGTCRKCGGWKGQYGLEPDYNLFIEYTLLWAQEAWRVLSDDGLFFLNMGDTYASPGKASPSDNGRRQKGTGRQLYAEQANKGFYGANPKCKLLIPHRIAIALIDAGWTLRNDIVWAKPNCMPESVKDRFNKKFEYIFMFSKDEKYYFDLDAIREVYTTSTLERAKRERLGTGIPETAMPGHNENTPIPGALNKNGKNPGDVWFISNQASPEKHYAMWPEKLVERMILCSTRPGDLILDPFAGSGTTLRVADRLNRIGLGIDLGYKEVQEKRLKGIQKELSI